MQRRSDTRERIQQVALALFTEQGYERTSLREIAESLDVTKAALYYHYKTKEDILAQVVDDALAKLDEVIAWAREQQPRDTTYRQELIRRYADCTDAKTLGLMRFLQANQPVVRELKSMSGFGDRMRDLFDLVSDPDSELAEQMRCRLALISIHMGRMTFRDHDIADDVLADTSLAVALDLVLPRADAAQ